MTTEKPDYGEPWKYDSRILGKPIYDASGNRVRWTDAFNARIVTCINFAVGIPDTLLAIPLRATLAAKDAEIERLKKDVDVWKTDAGEMAFEVGCRDSQISTLQARVKELEKFTDHNAGCAVNSFTTCTCGLSALTKGEM